MPEKRFYAEARVEKEHSNRDRHPLPRLQTMEEVRGEENDEGLSNINIPDPVLGVLSTGLRIK